MVLRGKVPDPETRPFAGKCESSCDFPCMKLLSSCKEIAEELLKLVVMIDDLFDTFFIPRDYLSIICAL